MNFIPRLGLAFALTIGASAPALAALGGDVASVLVDRDQAHGTLQITANGSYSVHEITTSFGTVREYLTPAGKVFGVSWKGQFMPDLRHLFGAYYAQYEKAAAAPHMGGHRHLSVELPTLVVHSNGRMRAFYGRAWVPDLIPQSVSADDIK
jgi:hypothetical protein